MLTTTPRPVNAASKRMRQVGLAVLLATMAVAAYSAYWWTQSSREVKPGAYSPSAPQPAVSLERRQSSPAPPAASPPKEPGRVAHVIRSAEPSSGARHAESHATVEQATDAELLEAEEQARLQAVQLELRSMLDMEAVDRDFRDRAQAEIDTAIEELGSTGVELLSTDCRRTLCRLELWSKDLDAMGDFLDGFPATLGWSTDMRMNTQDGAGGGVATTLFMTRDGVAMPTLASEQR
jgi:hypothetical protein